MSLPDPNQTTVAAMSLGWCRLRCFWCFYNCKTFSAGYPRQIAFL